MKRWTPLSAILGLILAVASALPAQQDDTSNGVLLIMDASGSMDRVDDRGVRLIDGAKDALATLLDAVPEGAPIGLRVYGHRVPEPDRAAGCADTELIVPVGPLQRDEMNAAIDSFDALGYTPIGASLRAAAEDLDGGGTIVLVSDGEDTCAPPDPCDVAAELLAAGFDLRVETIGFFVDDEAARSQLQCIAEATGGSYREVGNVESLGAEMSVLVGQSIPEVGRVLLPLQGGATAADATPTPLRAPYADTPGGFIGLEGAYQTALEPNATQWFSFDIAAGSGLGVSGGTGPFEAEPNGTIEITMLDSEGNDALRPAPSRGVAVADVAAVVAGAEPTGPWLSVSNSTEFQPWAQLPAEELANLVAQGYDEQRYNEQWLAAALAPLDDPAPAGPYAVGFTWHSEQVDGRMGFNWGVMVTAEPVELYGQVYERLDGGRDVASATALAAPRTSDQFEAYRFPPGEYAPSFRSYQIGAISSGSTSWYHQPMEFDQAVVVEALVVDTDGQPVEEGTLDLEVFDRDMASIGHPVPVTSALDPSGTARLAAVSTVDDGSGEPPPSSEDGAWLAITWTSPSGGSADVRLIVDVTDRYPNSSAPQVIARQPDQAAAGDSSENPASVDRSQSDESGADSGPLDPTGVLIGIVLAGTAAAALALMLVRRRRAASLQRNRDDERSEKQDRALRR